jgi:hypothetical protein
MAIAPKPDVRSLFADKQAIQQIVEEQNLATGFVKDPTATPQKAREMMRALGRHPEDNEFSRGIIAARDEE